ncbi:uncharacterized protein LOC141680237 [Apium graveolens]|uniref:uncharacterized protein LOC141680237 n=1 Tax=Apium graveolens TaxID=4045 RepID=UPI003D799D2F
MNSLAWNYQGLGAPGKIQFLQDVTRYEQPKCIFLSETISSRKKMEELCAKLRFEGLITVEPQGRSGGIAMLWKDAIEVNLMSMSLNHIDITMKVEGKETWRFTGIYGEPVRMQRRRTWELLRHLARDANFPWCLFGDFNNITSQQDKKGGHAYPSWLIDGFNDCLRDTKL